MKAALFDMDGTLIDSERYYFSIWQELMAQEGYHLEKDFYQHVVGSPTSILKEKFQNHFGELPMFDRLFEEFMDRRKQAQRKAIFPITDGCQKYLAYLVKQVSLVASSHPVIKKKQNIFLKRCDWIHSFPSVFTAIK